MSGAKIIEGLKDAVAGNFSSVTIEGQRWVREPQWRSAETAPKDGQPFLAWCPVEHFDGTGTPDDGEHRVIWWESRGQFTSDRDIGNEAFTRWMPLPKGPTP